MTDDSIMRTTPVHLTHLRPSDTYMSVMKLKVNVQLASWATWNEFQGAHFFELKLRRAAHREGGPGVLPRKIFKF